MAAHPGSDIPSASAREFMDSAVPMVLQWPGLGEVAIVISISSSAVMLPAASCRRASHSAVPEPPSLPLT
jgi:hypothetical protein